jgi:lipopolysaccharide/colanic/teichoic acid biosynthesis glycosyltransferase
VSNLDAPLFPRSLIRERDPGLSAAPEQDGAIGGLADCVRHDRWRSALDGESPLTPAATRTGYDRLKRFVDLVIALIVIVALLPLFPLIALLIVTTSPGPAIYRQRRLGHRGNYFWCYKFRTMVADAEEQLKRHAALAAQFQHNFKIKNDPRVTRLGALLRKTSLDELPQLFNVLRGEISLIGPRPIVEEEREKYGDYCPKLLSVKPGVSGMWQVYGRSDTTYDQRIAMDMSYIDNRSLWLDFKLISLTVYVVLRGRGAY